MKTRKSVSKRYKFTSHSKVKRKKAFKSHILEKKSPSRKTRLSKSTCLKKPDSKVIIRLINGFRLG